MSAHSAQNHLQVCSQTFPTLSQGIIRKIAYESSNISSSDSRGCNFQLREGRCFTLPPARRMDANKPVGYLVRVGTECSHIIFLQAADGILNSQINADLMCVIKHQTGHCSTSANELLQLRGTSSLSGAHHYREHSLALYPILATA